MDTPKQDPLVGHTLAGSYKILKRIAEEELGTVYDAVILPQNTPVSVKVLSPNLVEDVEAFGRFGREMLATATIQHPNSIKMIDFGEHRNVFHFVVLERLYARTLTQVIREERLSIERIVLITAQIASVLAAAHREGIVHRNLKPDNVLLLDNAEGDYVKVRDFGLARLQDEQGNAEDGGLTEFGVRVGSLAYMAPGYIRDGVVDPRGDLYALGVLLYEMIVGEPPFSGMAATLIEQHLEKQPPAPSSAVPKCPKWLDEFVLHLLQKDPHRRPHDASEAMSILQRNTGQRLGAPALVSPESALMKKTGGHRVAGEGGGTSTGLIIAVGVGGILVVGGLIFLGLVLAGAFAVAS